MVHPLIILHKGFLNGPPFILCLQCGSFLRTIRNRSRKGYMLNFCDLMCEYAEHPKETAVDGAGSCRTFVAIYCNLKKSLVHKNMPCALKKLKIQKIKKC